ncbi:hypothetical protein [Dactylosporangium sp. CA-092794]|uniref:hypothetical protein n=1 Tax=Dactylosporangium sp. CA-092794 TaxID=3239929 RepID=UPI003D8ED090
MIDGKRRAHRLGVATALIAVAAAALMLASCKVTVGSDHESGRGSAQGSAAPSAGASANDGANSALGSASAAPSASSSKPASPKPTTPPKTGNTGAGPRATPANVGVPNGTKLTDLAANLDGKSYRVQKDNTVLDKVHIKGDLLITAYNVKITNSQIDGGVLDEYGGKKYSFTLSDSTVGPATGCDPDPGVGESDYTATRVHIRGHSDGFRASGNNINIQSSYVYLCQYPNAHSDGIQTYMTGHDLTLNNTTIDQRDVQDVTAPIFIADNGSVNVAVTNNLVMGGTYSIQVKNAKGTVIVKNNSLVDHSWIYGPVESDCSVAQWSGNQLVTIDDNYNITKVVGPLNCN